MSLMAERLEDQNPPEIVLPNNQRLVLKQTREWAENFFREAEQAERVVMGSHGFDHNQRVAGMAAVLSVKEGYNPFLPIFTALIFDIGRTSTDPRAHNYLHGQLSVEMASDYIDSVSLLNPGEKDLVRNAIEDHPKLNPEVRETPLVKILMDADRLDTIGALAPVRAAATRWRLPLYAEQIGTSPDEKDINTIFQDFAFRVPRWFESLWTPTAKKIAEPRLAYLLTFVEEYQREAGFMLTAYKKLNI